MHDTRREDDARHLQAWRDHKSPAAVRAAGPPKPPRVKLFLAVEGRPLVEVYEFEPEVIDGSAIGMQLREPSYTHRRFRSHGEPDPSDLIDAALTVEVREFMGGHEAPPETPTQEGTNR